MSNEKKGATDKASKKIIKLFIFSWNIPDKKGAHAIPSAVGAHMYPLTLPIACGSKNKFGTYPPVTVSKPWPMPKRAIAIIHT